MEYLRPAEEACPEVTLHRRTAAPRCGGREISVRLRPGDSAMPLSAHDIFATSMNVGARSTKLTKSSTVRPGFAMPAGYIIASGTWFARSYALPLLRGNGIP